jgi:hypothetical protein
MRKVESLLGREGLDIRVQLWEWEIQLSVAGIQKGGRGEARHDHDTGR